MSISVEAAAARESLSDDKELINTYEADRILPYLLNSLVLYPFSSVYLAKYFWQRLTALDGKRRFALAAVASHKEEVGRIK